MGVEAWQAVTPDTSQREADMVGSGCVSEGGLSLVLVSGAWCLSVGPGAGGRGLRPGRRGQRQAAQAWRGPVAREGARGQAWGGPVARAHAQAGGLCCGGSQTDIQ